MVSLSASVILPVYIHRFHVCGSLAKHPRKWDTVFGYCFCTPVHQLRLLVCNLRSRVVINTGLIPISIFTHECGCLLCNKLVLHRPRNCELNLHTTCPYLSDSAGLRPMLLAYGWVRGSILPLLVFRVKDLTWW